ncbi:MAG: hypothetical protein OXB88_07560 [Bacteriovoracales bacterium]|nr:hypothetical protein [Bacteriovoracales bacterium]
MAKKGAGGTLSIKPNSRVLVGMTGGLASTVAAFLLKGQGFKVLGLGIQFFPQSDKAKDEQILGDFCHVKALEDAKSVCDALDIPFYAVDAQSEFQARILDQVATSRLEGRFFSTCMECHKIKFRLLQEKAKKLDCQFIATGHFAKIYHGTTNEAVQIHSSKDEENDQSHLLAKVDPKNVKNLILPLGDLKKEELMEVADRYQLKYLKRSKRTESCFFSGEKISHYIENRAHPSLSKSVSFFDGEEQRPLGSSEQGIHCFFIGQQGVQPSDKGHRINASFVVTEICLESRRVILGERKKLEKRRIKVERLRFDESFDRTKPRSLYVRFEEGPGYKCTLFFKNNDTALLELSESIYNKGKGHVAVFYNSLSKKARILGRGTVE